MRKPIPSLLLLLLLLPLLLSLPAMAVLPTNAEVAALLDKHLIANQRAKGVAVALVDGGGIRVVTAGVARDGQPLTADNLLEIGSVTKTFTGLLLAIADEKGEARLDDPVEKFLPAGLKLRDTAGAPIRLVDLATQRSGLPRLASNMLPRDAKNPYADYTEADLLDFIRNFTATRARNAQYEYSNIGFGLLGYVLVRAAGADSYDVLLTERVLKPLAMTSTTSDATKFAGRLVQPHDANLRPTPAWVLPLVHAGAGAIRSTAGDMGRYVEAVATLKDSTLSKAISLAITTRETGPGRINPIGLAWMSIPFAGRTFMNHDGGTFGSSSSLMVDRDAREGVFIIANTSVKLTDIALHLMDRRHSLAPREFPNVVSVGADVLARYAGSYRLTDDMTIVIRVNDGKVTAQATRQGEFEIFPETSTRFFAKVAPITITFGEFKDGRAAEFVIEQNGIKRTALRLP